MYCVDKQLAYLLMVRSKGLEPLHRLALPPQDSVSTIPPRSQKNEEDALGEPQSLKD